MLRLKKISSDNTSDKLSDTSLVSSGGISVSELNSEISKALASEFSNINVFGEIGSWVSHSSGHRYFTLKDEASQIKCVMWKDKLLATKISEGMKVKVSANLRVYAPRGEYQLDCQSIEPRGIGELYLQFERLKLKLQAEGLFDPKYKKELPIYPQKIGVITSLNGAAMHDILNTLSRRMPNVKVVLRSALVQGVGAKEDLAKAITDLNKLPGIDVIIFGRGGGSAEDLWAFNEELVARAIFNSQIPIISAVGHEVDFTIADFVADIRAATPTAAAELAVRNRNDVLERINYYLNTINFRLKKKIETHANRINALLRSYGMNKIFDYLKNYSQRIDELTNVLHKSILYEINNQHKKLEILNNSLNNLNPKNVLERGYAIVEKNDEVVSSIKEIIENDKLKITLKDGKANVIVSQ